MSQNEPFKFGRSLEINSSHFASKSQLVLFFLFINLGAIEIVNDYTGGRTVKALAVTLIKIVQQTIAGRAAFGNVC